MSISLLNFGQYNTICHILANAKKILSKAARLLLASIIIWLAIKQIFMCILHFSGEGKRVKCLCILFFFYWSNLWWTISVVCHVKMCIMEALRIVGLSNGYKNYFKKQKTIILHELSYFLAMWFYGQFMEYCENENNYSSPFSSPPLSLIVNLKRQC